MKRSSMVFVLLAVVLLATAVSAGVQNFSYDIPRAGWSLLAPAGIPLNPEPESFFGSIPIDGMLMRWNAPTQSLYIYDEYDPDVYGNVLLTDGFWLRTTGPATVSFSGLNDNETMDIWVGLPKRGWTMIGNPFNRDYTWADAKVTDGNTTKLLEDAASAGWLQTIGYGWNNQTQSLVDIGVPDDFATSEILKAWHGYWVQSNQDKLALILESM